MNFMQKLLIARQAEISYRRAQLAPPHSSARRFVWMLFKYWLLFMLVYRGLPWAVAIAGYPPPWQPF